MTFFRRRPHAPLPNRFMPLARYNTRVSGGIVHTAEYVESMVLLQRAYDVWAKETFPDIGFIPAPPTLR